MSSYGVASVSREGGLLRDEQIDGYATARLRDHVQGSSDRGGALPHSLNAQMRRVRCRARGKAAPVILDRDAQSRLIGAKSDADSLGVGVPRHVGKSLLDDAIQIELLMIGKGGELYIPEFDLHADSVSLGKLVSISADSRFQSEVIEDGGM